MKNASEWYSWRDLNPQKPDPKSGAYANSATAAYIKWSAWLIIKETLTL